MTWLAAGQVFGLFLAFVMHQRGEIPTHMMEDPKDRLQELNLLTDELLRRLDIITDNETRSRFQTVISGLHTYRSLLLWPIWLMARSSAKTIVYTFFIYTGNALIYGITAIWGFVIVGQMLLDYGNCIRVY